MGSARDVRLSDSTKMKQTGLFDEDGLKPMTDGLSTPIGALREESTRVN